MPQTGAPMKTYWGRGTDRLRGFLTIPTTTCEKHKLKISSYEFAATPLSNSAPGNVQMNGPEMIGT